LPNQFIIIDEAQNLSPHEIKTIITRCGEGTKIVLTGDPDQIDNPYMDKNNCGLSVAVEKLQDHPLVGHLTLSKGERSELANLAATKMKNNEIDNLCYFVFFTTSCLPDGQRTNLKTYVEHESFTNIVLCYTFIANKWGRNVNGYACCSSDFCEVKLIK